MQGKKLFEYAVIRVVPKVEREEFVNTGVILYCKDQGFLKTKISVNENKLKILAPKIDIEEITKRLETFCLICQGGKNAGPIGSLSAPERFRWLTSARSTIIQISPVHPGLCDDAEATLDRLFEQLVE